MFLPLIILHIFFTVYVMTYVHDYTVKKWALDTVINGKRFKRLQPVTNPIFPFIILPFFYSVPHWKRQMNLSVCHFGFFCSNVSLILSKAIEEEY